MFIKYELKEREISDNEFQKKRKLWKRHRIMLPGWHYSIHEIIDWVVVELTGAWHHKENFSTPPRGQPRNSKETNITFWFELEEDAAHFKLRWL